MAALMTAAKMRAASRRRARPRSSRRLPPAGVLVRGHPPASRRECTRTPRHITTLDARTPAACNDFADVDSVESCTECNGLGIADCTAGKCETGYHTFASAACTSCDAIAGGVGLHCAAAGQSQVTHCEDGYAFTNNRPPAADACTPSECAVYTMPAHASRRRALTRRRGCSLSPILSR